MGTPEATAVLLVIFVAVVILLVRAERRSQKKDQEERNGGEKANHVDRSPSIDAHRSAVSERRGASPAVRIDSRR
jgi:hypothetical protein